VVFAAVAQQALRQGGDLEVRVLMMGMARAVPPSTVGIQRVAVARLRHEDVVVMVVATVGGGVAELVILVAG
jgi:hypothetical protein